MKSISTLSLGISVAEFSDDEFFEELALFDELELLDEPLFEELAVLLFEEPEVLLFEELTLLLFEEPLLLLSDLLIREAFVSSRLPEPDFELDFAVDLDSVLASDLEGSFPESEAVFDSLPPAIVSGSFPLSPEVALSVAAVDAASVDVVLLSEPQDAANAEIISAAIITQIIFFIFINFNLCFSIYYVLILN